MRNVNGKGSMIDADISTVVKFLEAEEQSFLPYTNLWNIKVYRMLYQDTTQGKKRCL